MAYRPWSKEHHHLTINHKPSAVSHVALLRPSAAASSASFPLRATLAALSALRSAFALRTRFATRASFALRRGARCGSCVRRRSDRCGPWPRLRRRDQRGSSVRWRCPRDADRRERTIARRSERPWSVVWRRRGTWSRRRTRSWNRTADRARLRGRARRDAVVHRNARSAGGRRRPAEPVTGWRVIGCGNRIRRGSGNRIRRRSGTRSDGCRLNRAARGCRTPSRWRL